MTLLSINCLLEKESTSFEVQGPVGRPVSILKDLIKAKLSPRLDAVTAMSLTLWRVQIAEEKAFQLNSDKTAVQSQDGDIHPAHQLAPGYKAIEEFFPQQPEAGIHIIVRLPGISERELVQRVPPPIISLQGELGTSSAAQSYPISHISLVLWQGFNTSVCSAGLDDAPNYRMPTFAAMREYVRTENIRSVFSTDVGAVGCLSPETKTMAYLQLPRGDPSLLCLRKDDNLILFPVEVNTPQVLHIPPSTTYPQAYATAQSQPSTGLAHPLHQICGYMSANGYRYGVLTSFCQTWFLKTLQPGSKEFAISPTITSDQRDPTLLQSYLYLIRLANQDPHWKVAPPSEQVIHRTCQPDDDSGFRLGWDEPETAPSFRDMKWITQGNNSATFLAWWKGEQVVVKKCDVWRDTEGAEELEHEVKMYTALKSLQGRWIPRLEIEGVADGIDMVLVTEYVGRTICNEPLSESDCDQIRTAFAEIHALGIMHGDIRTQNIVVGQSNGQRRFWVIDFGMAKATSDTSKLSKEKQELERMLAHHQVEIEAHSLVSTSQ